jgi:hypothetical protein
MLDRFAGPVSVRPRYRAGYCFMSKPALVALQVLFSGKVNDPSRDD